MSLKSLLFKAVRDIVDDDEFWRETAAYMAAKMGNMTRRLITEGATAAESVGVIVDFDLIHQEALQVARTTSNMYWAKMTETTREGLRQALINWEEMGLGKRGLPDLINSLEPLFDKNRAKRIAETESTRLFAEGNKLAAAGDGSVGGMQWQTARDDRVCLICGPRDNLVYPKEEVPECPAHVRCRCAIIPVSWGYIRRHMSSWQGTELPTEEEILLRV